MVFCFALRAVIFSAGSLCYALVGVLSQLSKESDGTYAYSMPAVVLTAEFVKLCLSFAFLASERKSASKACGLVLSTSTSTWLLYSVPSVLYAVNSNLDMLSNKYMDPATEQVLQQLKIITTALAWRLVFGVHLSVRKWLSLVLLFVGCVGTGLPSSSPGKGSTMYIEASGVLLVLSYVCISAVAGVYNEWLYKVVGIADSVHLCNIRIYVVACAFSFFAHVASSSFGLSNLFDGFNVYTWSLILTYSAVGLLVGQIMKFFDSIVKLFISGSSMYVSAMLTWLIFGFVPSLRFVASLLLVTAALLLYNKEKIDILIEAPSKKD